MVKRRRRGSAKRTFFTVRRVKQLVIFLLMASFGVGGGLFLRGRVITVADGDTLTVFTAKGERQRIRLYGVDAPESQQVGGGAAAAFVRSRALFAEVEVNVVDTDKYGRAVALVTLPNGALLNEEMLKNGHAWLYDDYCRIPLCARWRVLEKEARCGKKGLWGEKSPLPPWAWRRKYK